MRRSNNRGFTLIELIIVIAILGILAAAVTLSLTRYIEKARTSTCLHNLDQINLKTNLLQIDHEFSEENITGETSLLALLREELAAQGMEAVYNPVQGGNVLTIRKLCPSDGNVIVYVSPDSGRIAVGCSKHKNDVDAFFYQTTSMYSYFWSLTPAERKKLKQEYGITYGGTEEMLDNDRFRELYIAMNGTDKLPELPKEIADKRTDQKDKLYLQTYFAKSGVLYYAAKNSTFKETGGWDAKLIYNPNDGCWYESKNKYTISNLHFPDQMTVASVYHDLSDPNKFTKLD